MTKFAKMVAMGLSLGLMGVTTAANAQVLYMSKDYNYENGMAALRAGEFEKAADYFETASRFDIGKERLLPVLNNLCAVNYALERYDAAEAACTRAIVEDRQFWRAYVNRGNVHRARGDYEAAKADYSKAVRLNPKGDLPKQALASLVETKDQLLAGAQ